MFRSQIAHGKKILAPECIVEEQWSSVLDFRSGGRWFEPSFCCRVVSLDKKLYSTLSLFTQVYKWLPAIIMLGDNLAMD